MSAWATTLAFLGRTAESMHSAPRDCGCIRLERKPSWWKGLAGPLLLGTPCRSRVPGQLGLRSRSLPSGAGFPHPTGSQPCLERKLGLFVLKGC